VAQSAIDDVDVHPVSAARFDISDLARQMPQIGTQNRRRNQNAARHGRGIHEAHARRQSFPGDIAARPAWYPSGPTGIARLPATLKPSGVAALPGGGRRVKVDSRSQET